MNELALFAGAGGGILGGHLLGWRCVCAVERDAYAAAVLAMRQNDGSLPAFPIWSDVETFDGRPWRGIVDVVSGGFPCQDISTAGKGAGITGSRSGLWKEFARIIGEVGPRYVLVENSPALTGRGMGVVLGDLAALGYDARWGVLGAVDAGAPHKRERIWIVADHHGLRESQPRRIEPDEREWSGDGGEESSAVADGAESGRGARGPRGFDSGGAGECEQAFQAVAGPESAGLENASEGGCEVCLRRPGAPGAAGSAAEFPHPGDEAGPEKGDVADSESFCGGAGLCEDGSIGNGDQFADGGGDVSDSDEAGCPQQWRDCADGAEHEAAECGGWWISEPALGRVAHGVAHRVDRLAALGNGQVPAVVRLAWEILTGKNEHKN